MENEKELSVITSCWEKLYPGQSKRELSSFIDQLILYKNKWNLPPHPGGWYKDVIVYSMYVDLFNGDFPGLGSKLEYLEELGVNCLWLLPILESPMRDAGFDISDYRRIRSELLGLPHEAADDERDQVFVQFLDQAHRRNIRVIFDFALNHTSDEHPWFRESGKSADNPYRDYYIWSQDDQKYSQARIIFKGLCTSNWEKAGDAYYFHRFFEFQPDLNYKNPSVLLEMAGHLLFWLSKGVDGFRADAIPYIWKEEGTTCENLPQAHTVIRFLRAVLDFVRPNTLLLAEACQKPHKVVEYFGQGDECQAAYHFPLMPQLYKAVAMQSSKPVQHTLSREVTPSIPENSQWFTFLRCHDELSLELVYVTEEDRKYIHENYCKKPEWDFRQGQGISARLSELMDRDPQKIGLIYSIMLTLPGTPVVYYGDEFGKLNDQDFYHKMINVSGKDDTRFLVRGKINWWELESRLADPDSYEFQVFNQIRNMIRIRSNFRCFGRGEMLWQSVIGPDGSKPEHVMACIRFYLNERVLVIHNLSGEETIILLPEVMPGMVSEDLLGRHTAGGHDENTLILLPYGYHWFQI